MEPRKPPYSEKQVKWAFAAEKRGELPKGDALSWAERLKRRKYRQNPFLASKKFPNGLLSIGGAAVGSAAIATANAMVTDKLPSKYHIPTHAAIALILPLAAHLGRVESSGLFAGMGGAAWYALLNEGIVKRFDSLTLAWWNKKI